MDSETVDSTTDEALRIKRDIYAGVAFFATISLIGIPVGAFLGYRAWQYHKRLQ